MLIVMYKPNSGTAIPDAQVKTQVEEWLSDIPIQTNKYISISQMLVVDAVRAVMIEKYISPDLVMFEVYNENNELIESVSVNSNFQLSSWKSFRNDSMNFIRTCILRKRNGKE